MQSIFRKYIVNEIVKTEARHVIRLNRTVKYFTTKPAQQGNTSQFITTELSQSVPESVLQRPGFCCGTRQYSTNSAEENIISSPWPDVHIPEVNLAHHVLENFPQHLNSVALLDGATGKSWTYAKLQDDIIKVGSALTRQGFKKGDVITLFSPNCPEFAIMYLAVAAIGGVVSAVNPLYTAEELHHALDHSHSSLVVTVPLLAPVAKKAAVNCKSLKEIVVFGEVDACRPFSSYFEDDGKLFPENVPCDAKTDMLGLPYSSGTTGLPKGVMLSHYNIVANIEQINAPSVMNYTEDDVFIGVLPFFHIYGQVVVLLSGLRKGVKHITVPKFDPQMYLQLAHDHKATYLHVVPPIVLFLAKHPMVENFDLSHVHTVFTGAAPIGPDTIKEAVDRLKIKSFRQGFGLTECSPVTHVNPEFQFKYETVGLPMSCVQCKVIDIESGRALGQGEEGEIVVRGPNVMLGYYNNPEATANTIKDGWLHTGDIGYYDEDHHVVISDRLKELIKVKGFQVAPAELEALLVTHPAIADAAVIGIPDERSGELPRAYVVKKPNMEVTAEEVKDFVKEKVAVFKKLEGGVIFRDEIPKSAAGKILRKNLKEEYNTMEQH